MELRPLAGAPLPCLRSWGYLVAMRGLTPPTLAPPFAAYAHGAERRLARVWG